MCQDVEELQSAKNNNMNVYEGHLGGYIMSGQSPAPSGLNIIHGDPETWSPDLWLWAMSALNVRSVLDIGCAEGHCIEFFSRYGCRVRGVDGSKFAKEHSLLTDCHDVHDFAEGSYTTTDTYDLVWCCEFVEHVEERYVDNFLQTFKAARSYILLTHARPGEKGWHHVNCQFAEYWEEKLDQIGFAVDYLLTKYARRVARGAHFKAKGLVFVRRQQRGGGL